MKIFVYKSLFIFVGIFILFQVTIGYQIKSFKKNLDTLTSKRNIELIKTKLRDEIKNAVKKEQYLDDNDAKLIGEFIKKIQKEINLSK
jgi:hypothetical protein